jgi:trk system potassium uptake protein TrkA
MVKPKEKKSTVFAVIGLGSFGIKTCLELSDRGATVIGIDSNADRVDKIKNRITQGIVTDATDGHGFAQTSLEDVDVAIVAIGDNIESSILTTALLKQRAVPRIIARAVNQVHQQVLEQVGAHEVINLEEDQAVRLATRLIAPQIIDRIPLSEEISISEVYCPQDFDGKSMIELELRKRLGITVIAVKRIIGSIDEEGRQQQAEQLLFPDAEFKLQEDDVVVVVGTNDSIEQLKEL